MVLKLLTRIFKMSRPPKRVKVIRNTNKFSVAAKENLEKLSQQELIQRVIRLEEHNCHLKNIIKKNMEGAPSENKKSRKKIDFDKVSKRHVLLKFYYLGWDYQGLVTQETTNNTIENHVLHGLKKCALIESQERCNYQRCGRTDKGVSAFSQVISLDLRSKLPEPTMDNIKEEYPFCAMLNRVLPRDIKCYAWCHVNSDTSARFNCTSRIYKYYFPKGDLNIEMMQKGAKFLIGSHDFRNFCKMDIANGVTEFIRHIHFVDIKPCSSAGIESSAYQMYEFVIKGNAFLLHQIRCIMSVLFLIGKGKESPEVVKSLLDVEENPCKPQYNPANPIPLNLFHVEYESFDDGWIVDEVALSSVLKILHSQWTEYNIKCTMIKDMISSLEKQSSSLLNFETLVQSLMTDTKCKTYKPLLLRNTCGSLEDKIERYTKKGKLEAVNT